jgi:hypothetical protein
MTKDERIAGFVELAQTISQFDSVYKDELFSKTVNTNPWFTAKNVERALNGIVHLIRPATISNWLNNYTLPQEPKQVGIVMAGNIPLVGFHDFLSVLLAGHKAVIKLSSQDNMLLPVIIEMLVKINPLFSKQILVVDKLTGIDAVIATGSDNSARYFNKYFKDIPHIIRHNRTSVAVLNGHESVEDLQLLGDDIFSYFGLGCRNVAKIFIPAGYDMKLLLDALEEHHEVINHPKYFNNYEYNKAIYLVNKTPHLDTGYALFTQSSAMVSPLAVIYYDEYSNENQLNSTLEDYTDKIQCIVRNSLLAVENIPNGKSQLPEIEDYADNMDTMLFL